MIYNLWIYIYPTWKAPYAMTGTTCYISYVDVGGAGVNGNTVIAWKFKIHTYLGLTNVYYLLIIRTLPPWRRRRSLDVPVLMVVCWIMTLVDPEISKPSVLGLVGGAVSVSDDAWTPLDPVNEMWFWGLLMDLKPSSRRFVHFKNLSDYVIYMHIIIKLHIHYIQRNHPILFI